VCGSVNAETSHAQPLFYGASDVTLIAATSGTRSAEVNMSSENNPKGEWRSWMRELGRQQIENLFADGYNKAASICIGMLSRKIDGLISQMESGPFLSEQEQFLLSSLTRMRSDTESALHDYWNNAGGE